MHKRDRKPFFGLLAALAELHSKEVSKAMGELYFDCLADLEVEAVLEVMRRMAKEDRFFPKPAEIRQRITGSSQDNAIRAWHQVKQAVYRLGDSSVEFEDRTIHAVIERLGGWLRFSSLPDKELDFSERDFLALYKACAERGASGPEHLTGFVEHHNTVTGRQIEDAFHVRYVALPDWQRPIQPLLGHENGSPHDRLISGALETLKPPPDRTMK